ncbi:MAG: hypothetical protein K2Y25_06495 [Pseudomonadaceae bacterium]|jgi:hypothetical protein|nr:hypothetical protein [Pseudomonadaceae bacterium]
MFSVVRGACLLLGVLTLLPVALQAAQPQALLASVNAQRLHSYQLQMQFHLLSLEDADPRVAAQMQAAAEQFAEQNEQLDELSAGLALDAEVLALQQQARDFQRWVLANEVLTQGWVSVNTLNAMSASGAALNLGYLNLLNKLRAQGSVDEPLLEQAILMQQIAAGYVRETSSLDGGGSIYDEARDLELPVDQLAQQFRQQLTLLQQQNAGVPDTAQRLQRVAMTWKYIEKTLLNYKEKAVPVTIVRNSAKIIDALLKPAASTAQL